MSINPSSLNRITGIASGMDTDTLVKKLMAGQQAKIDQIKQKQQKNLWLSESYRQWNSDLFAFRSTVFNAKLSSTFNAFATNSSQPNAISATGSGGAVAGSYNIQVNQLAQSASFTGKDLIVDSTKTLDTQGAFSLTGSFSLNLMVNDDPAKTYKLDINPTTDKISDIVSKINSAIDSVSGKSLGLQAIYDSNLKQLIIKTKNTGVTEKIGVSVQAGSDAASAQTFLEKYLGQPAGTTTTCSASGQNANILFNGNPITSLTSNTATIMGISWTFKSPTVDSNGVPTTATVNVSQDNDAVVKNIKDIITSYNDILSKLNKSINEPVYKDYLPLTDEQREEMSEKQIDQWESKAKSGLLRGDSILGNLLNNLRNTMNSKVNTGSVYNSLSSIGISSQNYLDKGKLTVDEKKLKEAIQADPDGVQKLFNQSGTTTDGTSGLLNTITEHISQVAKNLTTKAGAGGASQYDQSTIGKLLTGLQTKIGSETSKFQLLEDRYYRQFAAMEKAFQKYSSQSSWLGSQMSSGQGY
ncbi:MAG: hypothetical protein K0R71_1140 [Bacillales bacterium]|jgi:flagellar hook-associated protein 2|nr:hypothetical protein [Bacillales bacterium]